MRHATLGSSASFSVLEGSEIRLNERRYETERGTTITFADERRIFPDFDLRLNTAAGSYDITIAVTGTPDVETTLTSSPELPEPDIMAMLVTGRTLDDMRGEEYRGRPRAGAVVSRRSRGLDIGSRTPRRLPDSASSHRTDLDRRTRPTRAHG